MNIIQRISLWGGSLLYGGKLKERVVWLPLTRVYPNPHQPRRIVDEDALSLLVASIRTYGVIVPVLVRPFIGGYQLVAGERRSIAARQLGLSRIPAIVRSLTDDEAYEVSFAENFHRVNLSPLEHEMEIARLAKRLGIAPKSNLTVKKDTRSLVEKMERANLPVLLRKSVELEVISLSIAKELVHVLDSESQLALIEQVYKNKFSLEEVKNIVNSYLGRERTCTNKVANSNTEKQVDICSDIDGILSADYIDKERITLIELNAVFDSENESICNSLQTSNIETGYICDENLSEKSNISNAATCLTVDTLLAADNNVENDTSITKKNENGGGSDMSAHPKEMHDNNNEVRVRRVLARVRIGGIPDGYTKELEDAFKILEENYVLLRHFGRASVCQLGESLARLYIRQHRLDNAAMELYEFVASFSNNEHFLLWLCKAYIANHATPVGAEQMFYKLLEQGLWEQLTLEEKQEMEHLLLEELSESQATAIYRYLLTGGHHRRG